MSHTKWVSTPHEYIDCARWMEWKFMCETSCIWWPCCVCVLDETAQNTNEKKLSRAPAKRGSYLLVKSRRWYPDFILWPFILKSLSVYMRNENLLFHISWFDATHHKNNVKWIWIEKRSDSSSLKFGFFGVFIWNTKKGGTNPIHFLQISIDVTKSKRLLLYRAG